eukprot:6509169-Heterocapsa_arctica.AAC.1
MSVVLSLKAAFLFLFFSFCDSLRRNPGCPVSPWQTRPPTWSPPWSLFVGCPASPVLPQFEPKWL